MNINTQIQKLEPGTEIMLFELGGSEFDIEVPRFHGHAIPHTPQELVVASADTDRLLTKSTWWWGQEYSAWPVQISGIEANSNGMTVRPKFPASNVTGSITALCLAFNDLANFQLTIRETLTEHLDARSFPDGNPDADPAQESISVWYIDQGSAEGNEAVTWDSADPGDVGNEAVDRQMTTLCHRCMTDGYRSPDCGYTGPYSDIDDNPTDDPVKDQCVGLYRSCNRHWGQGDQLPFSSFPAVSVIARS